MFPGGGIQIPIGGGGFSLTTMLIIGAIMLLFGINPLDVLRGGMGGPGGGDGGDYSDVPQMPQGPRPQSTGQRPRIDMPGKSARDVGADEMGHFIRKVYADTEDVWTKVFAGFGKKYAVPPLVLYDRATRTACGLGQSAMGPFYCPNDQKVYIDLQFYEQMKRMFNTEGGDFAEAYVIAHEVGHHVQKQLGILDKVTAMKERMDEKSANALQVRIELQADCLAGVWANLNDQLKGRLEEGDVERALDTASKIGDDMIQKKMTGHIVPDGFTHGTAAQRVKWFKTGLQSGNLQTCDTFNAKDL